MPGDARTIASLMAIATMIALTGHTFETRAQASKLNPKVGDAQILLGGTAATVILVLVGQAGEPGAIFSKGIAVIALISTVALYGTPLCKGIANVTGPSTTPRTKTNAKTGATK